ncbi:MAG: DUF177 domain-containing protein [Magnetococcales bacterium]|nr:DUF177 domain-containing protein [Magnetococcales bacterium]
MVAEFLEKTDLHRDLSGARIELGSGGRDSWSIIGVLPPENLTELNQEALVVTPAQVDIVITKEKTLWRVVGDLEVGLSLCCSRCLAPFSLTLTLAVDRFFSVGQDPAESFGQSEMEEDIVYLESGTFVIRRFAEEEFILLLPMTPLCKQNCLGLCQRCGVDINQEPCGCPTVEKENPFSVLGTIKLS